jgi:hypothetical protein
MRTLQSLVGLAVAACVAAACGGGAGPLVTTTSEGRESPGTTRDTPPPTSDRQNSDDCLVCDVVYDCPNAGSLGNDFSLSSVGGTCLQRLVDVVCSGALFGTPPCTGGGGGPFTCGSITCTPVQQGLPPGTGSGGTGFADAG